jgi:hypothetical protein
MKKPQLLTKCDDSNYADPICGGTKIGQTAKMKKEESENDSMIEFAIKTVSSFATMQRKSCLIGYAFSR